MYSQQAHEHKHTYSTHIYIYTWPATQKCSTRTNTNSTKGLILFCFLADQDKSPLLEYIYIFFTDIYTAWIPLATGLRHSAYTGAGLWILSFPVGSCSNTQKQVSQLTSRSHDLPSSWPGPPGPSSSQCTDLWCLQHPALWLLRYLAPKASYPTHQLIWLDIHQRSRTDTRTHQHTRTPVSPLAGTAGTWPLWHMAWSPLLAPRPPNTHVHTE